MKVLVACEYSGTVRDAFTALGHDAVSCDILPTESQGNHYQGNVFDIINDGFDLMIAFPPCTYLSHAGIRWFSVETYGEKAIKRIHSRHDALGFVLSLYYSTIPKVAIENPVGYLSSAFRKPDQIIEPYYFGDNHRKRTCLWLKNLKPLVHIKTENMFEMATHLPEPQPLAVQFRKPSKYYKGGELKKRYFTEASTRNAHVRSRTFQGIADAMAEQWSEFT